jgi:hypothetical protein
MYRVYFMDRHGHVRSATDIRCDTDDEAIDCAASFRHDHELQVWQGDRLVWRFEDRTMAPPPPAAPVARLTVVGR